jgi:hypothetical protein
MYINICCLDMEKYTSAESRIMGDYFSICLSEFYTSMLHSFEHEKYKAIY